MGVFFDEKLCQEIPEIDVIFGIHTITLKMVNLTMAYLWPQLGNMVIS